MYYVAVTCLLALAASAKADGVWGGLDGLVYAPGHASADYYAYPRYAFEYAVKDPHTGDNKAQWEKRDGDVVKGAYSLVEPDGSLRVVEYWADDKSGFNAVVKRIGPNLHPASIAPASIYKAPIPVLGHGHAGVAPLTVGPVAKLGHLATAPLISGPIVGGALSSGALSSASLYKGAPIHVAPIAPVLPAPIKAPILPEPILPLPIKSAPLLPAPYLPAPILKSGPILPASYFPAPILKSGPILPAPYPIIKDGPILPAPAPLPLWKDAGLPLVGGWGDGLGLGLKGGLGGGHILGSDLGHGLLATGGGHLSGKWDGLIGDSWLGLKH